MLKLVTFNIRCDYDQDGANSFRFRKPVILKKLAEEKPDVICFQEVLPHVAAWLKENLTEYTVIGCWIDRNDRVSDLRIPDGTYGRFYGPDQSAIRCRRYAGDAKDGRICGSTFGDRQRGDDGDQYGVYEASADSYEYTGRYFSGCV